MTRDEIERFLRQYAQGWIDRDPSTLASQYAEDAVVESLTHGRLTTREAIRAACATWFEALPDLRFIRDDLIVEGDRAAVFFTSTGTHTGPFASIPASGRRMEIRGVFVMTFRDGLIAHEKRFYDSTSLFVQLGVIKPKPM
jgi:steroid delta-isomerase-like uncharacterized protein